MWTADALASEAVAYAGEIWRVVESQARKSTLRIADNLLEQQILEEEIETVKPILPKGVDHLDPLLRTPFRYAPYPDGSRFRRAGQPEGVYYASEAVETAIAEQAFLSVLLVTESPGMILPSRPVEYSAFAVDVDADLVVDLTKPPLVKDAEVWTHPSDYRPCQDMADHAREGGVQAIRYQSARDPHARANIAVLTWKVFASPQPKTFQTWHIFLRRTGVDVMREFPRTTMAFGAAAFANDPRVAHYFGSPLSPNSN
ncbi:MAG TPA: RES family NAD+ phosphorylase [Rhodospirillaceae bacterium]|nr:RES family NAD+ phosphorylase [Rhodospirillaceae bacterium]